MKLYEYGVEYDIPGRLKKSNIENYKTIHNILKTKCSHTFDYIIKHNRPPYWRGTKTSGNFGYYAPAKYKRESANTKNYYNLIFQSLPSWKGWPDRTKSIVGSSNASHANSYGRNKLIIFPVNNAIITYGQKVDFWSDFPELQHTLRIQELSDFNKILTMFFDIFGINVDVSDSLKFMNGIKELDKKLIALKRNPELKDHAEILISQHHYSYFMATDDINNWIKYTPLHKTFNQIFDPDANHLTKFRTDHIPPEFTGGDYEWWSEGPAFAITEEYFENVFNFVV